jgi:(p)ppGpp synthase/HD superfamily hydrolase
MSEVGTEAKVIYDIEVDPRLELFNSVMDKLKSEETLVLYGIVKSLETKKLSEQVRDKKIVIDGEIVSAKENSFKRVEDTKRLLSQMDIKVLEAVDFLIEFDKNNKDGEWKQNTRRSGEMSIYHPLTVLSILVNEFGFNKQDPNFTDLYIASILHDVYEDEMEGKGRRFWKNGSRLAINEIKNKFGDKVSEMVDGLSKFKENGKVNDKATYESLLTLALVHPGLLKIKLADRLHNWRTIRSMELPKKIESVKETQEFFMPIAIKVGMAKVVAEFDDCIVKVKSEVVAYNKENADRSLQMLTPGDFNIDIWLKQVGGGEFSVKSTGAFRSVH